MNLINIFWYSRNSVRLAIRKLTYAPEAPAPQPSAEAKKDFMMSPGHIKLEASLDKEVSDNSAILSLTYLNKMCQVVSDPMITVSSYEGNG